MTEGTYLYPADGYFPYVDDFEVDDMPVCENCLALDTEVDVTFDHWSGRNLCIECEPHPMMDDGTRR